MLEILEKYPEAAKVVNNYYLEIMLKSLNDDSLPENFKEFVREMGVGNDKIAKIIEGSPRTLFDVFDENQIYIEISVSNDKFSYKIYPRDVKFLDVIWYDTRKEVEKIAILDAFKLLNDKICEQTQS
jgi:hypothetical protein